MAKKQQVPAPSNTADFKGFPFLCAVLGQKLTTYTTGDLAFYCILPEETFNISG